MAKRVLVIDDDVAIRKSFKLALEDTAYDVETAESGEAGIIKLQKDSFDLVFLDLKMPGLNGPQTLLKIREKDLAVPVYLITAFHEEFLGQLESAANEGIEFEVLQKPISSKQIESVAKSVLEGPLQV